MTMNRILLLAALLLLLSSSQDVTQGYVLHTTTPYFRTRRMDLSMKRGRGSFKKEISGDGDRKGSGMSSSTRSINWCPIPAGQKLPQEQGKIGLLDTNLPTMKNSATNPTGAVAVAKFEDRTFCFSSSCPSCKIPMTKAKLLPASADSSGSPRIICDFCKATYSLKSGARLASAESGGLFGGFVKSVFAAKNSGSLPIYKLGEMNGKLVVAVD